MFQVINCNTWFENTTEPTDVCIGNEFQCDEGRCIPISSVCNQVSDCVDGTDEEIGHDCPVGKNVLFLEML